MTSEETLPIHTAYPFVRNYGEGMSNQEHRLEYREPPIIRSFGEESSNPIIVEDEGLSVLEALSIDFNEAHFIPSQETLKLLESKNVTDVEDFLTCVRKISPDFNLV